MEKIYDLAIIGGGPAGYTAALYGVRSGLSVAVVEKTAPGGQMALTGEVDNYPGFDEGVDGFELGMKMQKGAERFGAESRYGEIEKAELSGKLKSLYGSFGRIDAKTVIIATGAEPAKLGLDGEDELLGAGLHYCAHCDGRFYKGKTVAVVGGGNSAVQDALYLSRLAEKVYLIHRRDSLRAERIHSKALLSAPNVEILWNSFVGEIITENHKVSGAVIRSTAKEKDRELLFDGLFVSIGRKPSTEFLKDSVALDEKGYVIAGEDTKTNLAGVFAAGDVRTKALRQIVTAAADGAVAAHFALEYVEQN